MAKGIQTREPLTEQEVFEFLSKAVISAEKQWGPNSFWTDMAKKTRDTYMADYHAGKVVPVYSDHYADSYGNGCGDFTDTLFSDGHVETACYGYLD